MKRTMILVAVVMAIVMAFGMDAHAGVRDDAVRAKFEAEMKETFEDSYERFEEQKADGEIHLIKEYKMDYKEVGINVYDIQIHVVLEDGSSVEAHAFYDAVEDEYLSTYIQIGNERLSVEEFDELYPELCDEMS